MDFKSLHKFCSIRKVINRGSQNSKVHATTLNEWWTCPIDQWGIIKVIHAKECTHKSCSTGFREEQDCLIGSASEIDQLRVVGQHARDNRFHCVVSAQDHHAEHLDITGIGLQSEVLGVFQTIIVHFTNDVDSCKSVLLRKLCPCYPLPIATPNKTVDFKIPAISQIWTGGGWGNHGEACLVKHLRRRHGIFRR